MIAAGLPVCRFQIERRITDLERNKQCLKTRSDKEVHALLCAQLRLDRLLHYNVRDAARKTNAASKLKKQRAMAVKRAIKKRYWKHKQERKETLVELMKAGASFGVL